MDVNEQEGAEEKVKREEMMEGNQLGHFVLVNKREREKRIPYKEKERSDQKYK